MNKPATENETRSSQSGTPAWLVPLKVLAWPFAFVWRLLYKNWLSYLFGSVLRDEHRIYSIKFIWYGECVYLHPMVWGSLVLSFVAASEVFGLSAYTSVQSNASAAFRNVRSWIDPATSLRSAPSAATADDPIRAPRSASDMPSASRTARTQPTGGTANASTGGRPAKRSSSRRRARRAFARVVIQPQPNNHSMKVKSYNNEQLSNVKV